MRNTEGPQGQRGHQLTQLPREKPSGVLLLPGILRARHRYSVAPLRPPAVTDEGAMLLEEEQQGSPKGGEHEKSVVVGQRPRPMKEALHTGGGWLSGMPLCEGTLPPCASTMPTPPPEAGSGTREGRTDVRSRRSVSSNDSVCASQSILVGTNASAFVWLFWGLTSL